MLTKECSESVKMFYVNGFSEWLREEMDNRGMKQADLSRLSKLTTATVSNLLNERRNPGEEACSAIARALKLPEETVFRAAGLLQPAPASDPLTEEILHLARKLPPEDIQDLIDLARSKLSRHERTANAARKP